MVLFHRNWEFAWGLLNQGSIFAGFIVPATLGMKKPRLPSKHNKVWVHCSLRQASFHRLSIASRQTSPLFPITIHDHLLSGVSVFTDTEDKNPSLTLLTNAK